MKNKTSLFMMEQMMMILIFALAAALCLQVFIKSDQLSQASQARDRAVVLCQSAAEAIRHTGGDFPAAAGLLDAQSWDGDSLTLFYGADWELATPVSENVYEFGYTLGVCRVDSGVPGLGRASVWATEDEKGAELFRMEVSWQEEVTGHG